MSKRKADADNNAANARLNAARGGVIIAQNNVALEEQKFNLQQAAVSALNQRESAANAGPSTPTQMVFALQKDLISALRGLNAASDALHGAREQLRAAIVALAVAEREVSYAHLAAERDFSATKSAFDALAQVQRSVSAITLKARVAQQGTTSGDAASTHTTDIGDPRDKKPKLSPSSRTSAIAASGNHVHPQVTTTLDDFLDRAKIEQLPDDVATAVTIAQDAWWQHARIFVPKDGRLSFGQLLRASLTGDKLNERTEVAPVFASLMVELMRALSVYMPSLLFYSEADLTGDSLWPTFVTHDTTTNFGCIGVDVSTAVGSTAGTTTAFVPRWFVRQRDARCPTTHRNLDQAFFTHDIATRDTTTKFNLCAKRNVCTATELTRDLSDNSMRAALSQLSQDYTATVGSQFVGERRVVAGIMGSAAKVRLCQMWSVGSRLNAFVSPIVAIATLDELDCLLSNSQLNWSDVVASNPTFLETVARVVLHHAGAPALRGNLGTPKIDCGLRLPVGKFNADIGNYVSISFEQVLGVTNRSIVVRALVSDSEGNTMHVAFKRYTNDCADTRQLEVDSYAKFGGVGVVSLVGDAVDRSGVVEAIATAPVGIALLDMCLCGAARARRLALRCAMARSALSSGFTPPTTFSATSTTVTSLSCLPVTLFSSIWRVCTPRRMARQMRTRARVRKRTRIAWN